MKLISTLFFVLALSGQANADYFQYAQLVQTEYTGGQSNYGIILAFSTDPGSPITVIEDEGGIIEGKKQAYIQFFDQAKWGTPDHYDVIYMLNVLGSKGWSVVSYEEINELVFTNKYPGKTTRILLKKELEKPNKLSKRDAEKLGAPS